MNTSKTSPRSSRVPKKRKDKIFEGGDGSNSSKSDGAKLRKKKLKKFKEDQNSVKRIESAVKPN
jgi:hypothetical protein